MKDQLGNNRIGFSYFSTGVQANISNDYYAFGWMMSQKFGAATFGFNGQRIEDLKTGLGTLYEFRKRESDPRIGGRFMSIDPLFKQYPWNSTYAFAENSPVRGIDLEGLEIMKINASMYQMKYLGHVTMISENNAARVDLNKVDIIQKNVPYAYPVNLSYNVGIHGHDVYGARPYSGPTMRATEGQPYEGYDDLNERAMKGSENAAPSAGENVYVGTAGVAELLKWGKETIEGNLASIAETFKEPPKRQAFYRSTNLVDDALSTPALKKVINYVSKINTVGNYRADLINYVTDGSLPQTYNKGMTEQNKKTYIKAITSVGNRILQENGYDVPNTQKDNNKKE